MEFVYIKFSKRAISGYYFIEVISGLLMMAQAYFAYTVA
jgi:hypothetical protein